MAGGTKRRRGSWKIPKGGSYADLNAAEKLGRAKVQQGMVNGFVAAGAGTLGMASYAAAAINATYGNFIAAGVGLLSGEVLFGTAKNQFELSGKKNRNRQDDRPPGHDRRQVAAHGPNVVHGVTR